MKVVHGEYENGVVRPLEEVPQIKSKKVLITFFEEDDIEEEVLRRISLQQPQHFLNAYFNNEGEDLYQEYLNNNKKQLQKESRLVQNESMKVLKEFENLKDED